MHLKKMADQEDTNSSMLQARDEHLRAVATNFVPSADLLGVSGTTQASGVQLMPRGYTLTMPENDDIFGVKEDQLNELVNGGKSWALELSLTSGGIAFGYVPSAIDTAKLIYASQPISILDVCLLALFVALSVVAILKGMEHKKNASNIDSLKARIKSGQKMKVG